MTATYKVETIDGRDYVSVNDAKKILGVATASELRSLGVSTISIGDRKPVWSVAWLIKQAKRRPKAAVLSPDLEWIDAYEKRKRKRTRTRGTGQT